MIENQQPGGLPPFNNSVVRMGIAATKRMNLEAVRYPDAILLAQGIPSFHTAEHIKEAAKKAIDDDLCNKYTKGSGILSLREAIAQKVGRDNGITASPEQVIVTHGGIQALQSTFQALLERDDELIVLTPDYPSHFNQLVISSGRPVDVPLTETHDDWVVDPQRLDDAVTDRTKAILITNPSNPTGKVYTQRELEDVAQVALRRNLFIVTDEMYEYFTFDGRKHISIGSFPEVADRTISIFGLSKAYAMTGWRIGYIVAGQDAIDEIFKVHDSMVTCATAVSQYGALAAIEGPQDVVEYYKNVYEKRRQIVMDELSGARNMRLQLPQGAYYAFPKIEVNGSGVDDQELAMQLLRDAGVATIYGSAAGKGGESHLRISFGAEVDQLQEGLKRFKDYISTL